jgi:hypothetical protein
MSSFSISSVINSAFVARFSRIGGAASSNTADNDVKFSSGDQVSTTLQTGSRTLTEAYQNLGNAAGFVTASEQTLKKLDKILGKVITLAENASKSSTSSGTRGQLTAEYKKLASEFSKLTRKAQLGDFDLLNKDDLSAVLTNVGLDPTKSESIAKAFKKFVFPPAKKSFASTETQSKVPLSIPSDPGGGGSEPTVTTIGTAPSGFKDAQLGDVNGDGIADLVSYTDNLQVQLGNSDGTFGTATSSAPINIKTPTGSFDAGTTSPVDNITSGTSIIQGDFTGDGILDLVQSGSSTFSSGTIYLFAGNGNGSFKAGISATYGSRTFVELAAGDYNNDGVLDLLGVNTAGQVSITTKVMLQGNGNGSFKLASEESSYDPGGSVSFVKVISIDDIDGDGIADQVESRRGGQYYPAGTSVRFDFSSNQAPYPYSFDFSTWFTNPIVTDLDTTDVNNDGLQDVIAATTTGIVALVRDSSNMFTAIPNDATISGAGVSGFAMTGDFNNDGKVDVVTQSAILLGNGNGSFQAAVSTFSGDNVAQGSAADVDGDGNLDIIRPGYTLLGNGNGTFRAGSTLYNSVWSSVVGDFNNDSVLDIGQLENSFPYRINVYLGNGTPQPAVGEGENLTLKDLNNDGKLDAIFAGGAESSSIYYAMGNGNGSFGNARALAVPGGGSGIYDFQVGEFWGADGKLDIAAPSPTDPQNLIVFRGNGNGTFGSTSSTNLENNLTPQTSQTGDGFTASADFNNDSKLDYITTSQDGTVVALGSDAQGGLTFQRGLFSAGFEGSNSGLHVSDFNGDGIDDIVTTAFLNGNPADKMHVFLGNGNGTYQAAKTISGVTSANGEAASADLNNDGKMDLVVRQYTGGGVYSLLGNGNGTFSVAASTTGFDDLGINVELADVTGDGKLDLITQGWSAVTNRFSIFLAAGNGNGTFGAAVTALTNAAYDLKNIQVADVNNDNKIDLIAGDQWAQRLYVSLGNNNGTFAAAVSYSTAGWNATINEIADINADGSLDLMFVSNAFGTITNQVMLGNGNGSFKAATGFATGIRDLSASDIDGDAILDLVGAGANGGGFLTIMKGNGNGTFSTSTTAAISTATSGLSLIDSNQDGVKDLVTNNLNGFDVYLGKTSGAGFRPETRINSLNGSALMVADLDNDTKTDDIAQLVYDNSGTFATGISVSSTQIVSETTVADFNGDGVEDYAATNRVANTVSLFLGLGGGTYGSVITISGLSSPQGISSADLNNDGKMDIFVGGNSGSVVSLLGNGNGTFASATAIGTTTSTSRVTQADVNGDGFLDVMTNDSGGGTSSVKLFLSNGNGTFKAAATAVASSTAFFEAVELKDVNNDGKMDFIAGDYNTGNVYVGLGNGNGTFATAATFGTGVIGAARLADLDAADINNDGAMDIVGVDYSANTVSVLLGNGNGTFKTRVSYASIGDVRDIDLADVTGDGVVDIVGGSIDALKVGIWTGTGNGTFSAVQSMAAGGQAWRVTLSDTNNDGTKDFIVSYNAGITTFTGNGQYSVNIQTGNGNGTFKTTDAMAAVGVTNPNNASFASGDFNQDNKTDILLSTDTGVFLYSGNGSGTFADATTYEATLSTGGGPILTTDVNNDGQLDTLAISLDPSGQFSTTAPDYLLDKYGEVAYGDFNEDGITDLIATNQETDATGGPNPYGTIFLGNGNGSYKVGSTFTITSGGVATIVEEVLVADINGDGLDDLVTANGYDNTMTTMLGNGNGTFKAGTNLTGANAGGRITSIAFADYNGDGKKDLIYNDVLNSRVGVFTGNGNGTFNTSISSYSLGTARPDKIITAELDGDAGVEILAVNAASSRLTAFLGNGNGTFETSSTALITLVGGAAETLDIEAADFDNDGKIDVAASFTNRAYVAMLKGNGNGTFASAVTSSVSAAGTELEVSDINGDGLQDLVSIDSAVRLLVGAESGSTHVSTVNITSGLEESYAERWPGSTAGIRVALGDFDGDGVEETVTASGGDVTINSYTMGQQWNPFGGGASASITTGDFDGDGKTDLAVSEWTTTVADSVVKIYLGSDLANSNATPVATVTGFAGYKGGLNIAAGDYDGDGKGDLTIATAGVGPGGAVITYKGNGNGTFGSTLASFYPYTSGYQGGITVAMGDVDEDGKADIITGTGELQPAHVKVYSQGSEIRNFYAFENSPGVASYVGINVAAADVNGDGKADIVVGARTNNHVKIFDGATSSLISSKFITASSAGVNVATSTKQSGPQRTVSAIINTGGGNFSAGQSLNYKNAGMGWSELAVFDANGDGAKDVVMAGGSGIGTLMGERSGTIKLRKSGTSAGDPAPPIRYEDVFSSGRTIRSRADAIALAADAKKLRANIRANIAALGKARDAIGENMEFVRSSALGMYDAQKDQSLMSTRDASDLAEKLRRYILGNLNGGSLSESGNLERIINATLLNGK